MHFTEKKLAVIFGSCCEIFGNCQKWLEVFRNLWQSSEAVGKIIFRNSCFVQMKNLAYFTEKKLVGNSKKSIWQPGWFQISQTEIGLLCKLHTGNHNNINIVL